MGKLYLNTVNVATCMYMLFYIDMCNTFNM